MKSTPPASPLPKGRLEWQLLLDWLLEDAWISADDAERVSRRFGAGAEGFLFVTKQDDRTFYG